MNIFYMMLEKLQSFAEGKYDVSGPASQVAADYEYKLTDAREQIEALNVTKRIVSTCCVNSLRVFVGYRKAD